MSPALAGRFLALGPPGLPFAQAEGRLDAVERSGGAALLQCIDGLLPHSPPQKFHKKALAVTGFLLAGRLLLPLDSKLLFNDWAPVCLFGRGVARGLRHAVCRVLVL